MELGIYSELLLTALFPRDFPDENLSESVLTLDTFSRRVTAHNKQGGAVPVYPSRLTLRTICRLGPF